MVDSVGLGVVRPVSLRVDVVGVGVLGPVVPVVRVLLLGRVDSEGVLDSVALDSVVDEFVVDVVGLMIKGG